MNLRSLASLAAWLLVVVANVDAQDPFGDLDEGTRVATDQPKAADRSSTDGEQFNVRERDAVVLSLRRDPPRDAVGIAKAAQWMARIHRWDEAARWLDQLGAGNISPEVARQIVEAIGSRPLLEMEMEMDGLNDAQRATASKIRRLASESIQDPKALAARVEQLRRPSRGERLAAFEALKAAGDFGITAIINAMLDQNAQAPSSSMIEAFSLLGDHTPRAWQVAMTTPHADARQRLVALVAPLPKPKMGCELMAELHDPSVNDSVRQSLERSLTSARNHLPTPIQANRFALELVDQSIEDYQRRSRLNEVDTEVGWTLDAGGRSISQIPAMPAMLALARASQAAQIAVRLVPESNVASAVAIAAHWEFLSSQGALDATQDRTFLAMLPESLRDSPEFACLIWDAALSKRLSGAQAVAVANLSRWEGVAIPGPVRERLVTATRSGFPMVRYPATVALMKSKLEASANDGFYGSSRMEAVAGEMRQLSTEPIALIVGGNEGLRGHMNGLLEQFGYRLFDAASAAEVFQLLRSGLPVESIFIIEHVRELDLGQLVQRIRAHPTTSAIPIAMLADSLSRGEHSVADEDHRVIMSGVPPTVDALADIMDRLRAVVDPPAMTAEARILFRESAENYALARGVGQSVLGRNSGEPNLAATREEQSQLLRILADSTESALKREQASRNFVQSVRRFGLFITSETVQDQYHVYNQRGELEPVTRACLGRALDAIEASNGQRSWGEIAP
jgi:hypothetical protein